METSIKRAILIGNSNYSFLPKLDAPENDIKELDVTLKKYGFQTKVFFDLTQKEMEKTIKEFKSYYSKKGIYLLYFSGHGGSADSKNYLFSIDAKKSSLQYYAISMDELFIEDTNKSVSLFFIDACRNNLYDFLKVQNNNRSCNKSLFQGTMVEGYIPDNTIVCFSTSFGHTAKD